MKKLLYAGLFFTLPLFAQTGLPGTKAASSTTPGPSKTPTTPTTPAAPAVPKEKEEPPIKQPTKVAASGEISYLSPGMIVYRGGSWVGGDNLLNISKEIPVRVEFVLPVGRIPPVTETDIKKKVTDIFSKVGIGNTPVAFSDKPPLPYFHIFVMVQPIEKGFAAYVCGRLFEEATLSRVVLNEGSFFQVVTWEKQDLVVASPGDIGNEVTKIIEEIANNFADRYKYYENIKSQLK